MRCWGTSSNRRGQKITLIEMCDSGWWFGHDSMDGKRGFFPHTVVCREDPILAARRPPREMPPVLCAQICSTPGVCLRIYFAEAIRILQAASEKRRLNNVTSRYIVLQ